MTTQWRVLLATQHEDRAHLIERALTGADHRIAARISLEEDFALNAQRAQPDMVVVELGESVSGLLGQVRRLMHEQPLPIAVFADKSSADEVRAAVKAGVSAYVVDGLKAERVIPVLEAAMTRFVEFEGIKVQRDEAMAKLAERRDIERAKGILMRRRDLAEQAAHEILRKMAMDRGARMIDVAKSIIAAEELLAQG